MARGTLDGVAGGGDELGLDDPGGTTSTLSIASGDVSGASSSTGSGTAMGHIQPTVVVNYIIKI